MSAYESTADARATEGVDVVRHSYRTLTEQEKARMCAIKDAGANFLTLCDASGASRELSIAKTNIEQAVMWAVKHITRPG